VAEHRRTAILPSFHDEPVIEENVPESQAIVQAFTVKVGVDTSTVTGTTSVKVNGTIYWGTATGVYTNYMYREATYEWQPDNTLQYRLTYLLPNLQLQAAQAYFAKIFFTDGTATSELTWTQPALNASPSDQVFFYDRVLSSLGTIIDISTRAADQGWLSNDDYVALQNRITTTAWLNTVKWNDGR